MTALLEVKDLKVAYGKIEAVKGISFSVHAGEIVTLIGTNGAGKTTTLRTLSGLLKPVSGSVVFDGEEITGVAPTRWSPRASPTRPKAAGSSRTSPSRRTSSSALPPQGRRGHRARHRALLRALPHPRGAPQAGGGHPLRR